jgi:glycosyltransferase involved in cell wall biosynthesis
LELYASMRVTHVIHWLEPGGAESLLVELASAAWKADLQLSVVTLAPVRDRRYIAALAALGVEVVELDVAHRWDPLVLRRGVSAIRSLKPTLIHTHLKHADIVGAVAARRLRLPLVSTLHVIEDHSGTVSGVKMRLAAAARGSTADRTIAVSEAQRQWYLSAFHAEPDRVVTIYNGVRAQRPLGAEERSHIRAALGIPQDAVMFLQAAIMRPGKGHGDLIRGWAQLGADKGWLVLAGDGPLRPSLEELAQSLAASRITFTGFRDDVRQLMSCADVVVHPTHLDALPTSVIEAMAAGRPVVASDVGGVPELITQEEGILVPPGDEAALARAITTLGNDEVLRGKLGSAAHARFKRSFDVDVWVQNLRALYDEVTSAT